MTTVTLGRKAERMPASMASDTKTTFGSPRAIDTTRAPPNSKKPVSERMWLLIIIDMRRRMVPKSTWCMVCPMYCLW